MYFMSKLRGISIIQKYIRPYM
ncbi:hypothetical protein CHELA1G2_10436 [Hyphomicrobiales bacterium]|nr:hypothetical protein CHELA1G2_10436 [Hyphomicrobiales bacterium]